MLRGSPSAPGGSETCDQIQGVLDKRRLSRRTQASGWGAPLPKYHRLEERIPCQALLGLLHSGNEEAKSASVLRRYAGPSGPVEFRSALGPAGPLQSGRRRAGSPTGAVQEGAPAAGKPFVHQLGGLNWLPDSSPRLSPPRTCRRPMPVASAPATPGWTEEMGVSLYKGNRISQALV